MNTNEPLPMIRPLDITPFQNERDEPYFALQDMTQVAPRGMAVSHAGYFILAHMDGRHTCADVQAGFIEHFGQSISAEQIYEMVKTLDEALLLETEHFEREYRRLCDEYEAGEVRDCRHKYPPGDELRAYIEEMLSKGRAAPAEGLCGIIAPHLDYARGAACYADVYASLCAAPPAERYVILGTNHYGRSGSATITTKDFLTPLGRVATDRAFIEALEASQGCSLTEHQFDHNAEHSIELQVQILQACRDGEAFEIVPVLCPDPSGPTGTRPYDGRGPDLGEFAEALGRAAAESDKRTLFVAGADLSHVGQRFGDEEPTTPEYLAAVERSDRELLALLEKREDEAFVQKLRESGNPTRICGVGCIYTLLRATPGRPCRVLRYDQAVDMESETHVTCAGGIVVDG